MGLFTSLIHRDRGDIRMPGCDATFLDSSLTSSPNFGASENFLLDHYLRLPDTVGLEVYNWNPTKPTQKIVHFSSYLVGFFLSSTLQGTFPYPTKREKEKHRLNSDLEGDMLVSR